MSAVSDVSTDWQAEVLDLKRQGMTSAQIAEVVGKHAATVRKVIARAKDDDPIPGQTTADDHLEPEADPLDEFRGEAGDPVGDMPKQPAPEATHYETRLAGTQ